MNKWPGRFRIFLLFCLLLLLVPLVGCNRDAGLCPGQRSPNLSGLANDAEDDASRFRLPLDDMSQPGAPFQVSGMDTPTRREYHAAEDYNGPPGTPVYAMADGEVSFSGRMGGYGWLVIVDHPQANLYSLYGHLSPSRWQIDKGPVKKGTLLGYLGDDDENGGSAKEPLRPHLHLGIRAGQRKDYPGAGEWRWQAGWISPCPTDLGWLKPSAVITALEIPPGGFEKATGGLLEMLAIELLLVGAYLIGGVGIVIYGFKRQKPFSLMAYGAGVFLGSIVLNGRGFSLTLLLLTIAPLILGLGLVMIINSRRKSSKPQA